MNMSVLVVLTQSVWTDPLTRAALRRKKLLDDDDVVDTGEDEMTTLTSGEGERKA